MSAPMTACWLCGRDVWHAVNGHDGHTFETAEGKAVIALIADGRKAYDERDEARRLAGEVEAEAARTKALIAEFAQDEDSLDDTVGVVVDALRHAQAASNGIARYLPQVRTDAADSGFIGTDRTVRSEPNERMPAGHEVWCPIRWLGLDRPHGQGPRECECDSHPMARVVLAACAVVAPPDYEEMREDAIALLSDALTEAGLRG